MINVLDDDSLLKFVELGLHDSQSNCFYNVTFDFLFLNSQHLGCLGVACLIDFLEDSGDCLDFNFSCNFLFVQIVLRPNIYFLQSRNVTSHSCLKQWEEFVSLEWFSGQDVNCIIIERVTENRLYHKLRHSLRDYIGLIDNAEGYKDVMRT